MVARYIKQEMNRSNANIIEVGEIRWTNNGQFLSD